MLTFIMQHIKPQTNPTHLNGLAAIAMPENHLWQKLISDANLEAAFQWLTDTTNNAGDNSDVWRYRQNWAIRKTELQQQLKDGGFKFQPTLLKEITNDEGQPERIETRPAEDRLVIRALAEVMQPVLKPALSKHCTHLKDSGGLQQTVRVTQNYITAHPEAQVIKSDVHGYYAHIDHVLLMEQLHLLLPKEKPLLALVWQSMRRDREFGGLFESLERGLPLGSSLSPLLAAVYLTPLDTLAAGVEGSFYRRYMDD
jgi:hypothetical protein